MMLVETNRVTLTNRVVDLLEVSLMEVYTKYINTIVFNSRLQRIRRIDRIICKRGSVLLNVARLPSVFECLVDCIANINRVSEHMCLMNREVHYPCAVTTELTWHRVTINTCCSERIAVGGVCTIRFLPGMIP